MTVYLQKLHKYFYLTMLTSLLLKDITENMIQMSRINFKKIVTY